MGYYVYISDTDFSIPKAHLEDAYTAMCDINQFDQFKTGGGPKDKWFSWMRPNYPDVLSTAEEILNELGFEFSVDPTTGDLISFTYDSKIGNEDIFFCAIAPFIKKGSYINWVGEDGEMWQWYFTGGRMQVRRAVISYGEPEGVIHTNYKFNDEHELTATTYVVNDIIFGMGVK